MASLTFVVTVRPSLRGTWRATYGWYEDDGHVGTFVDTLTFTKERYILYRAHYRDDGTFNHQWTHSGTWTPAGRNTVTRIYLHNHDDNDDTSEILTSISKNYGWGDDSRDLLLMHHWPEDSERTEYDAYRRVPNPLPSPLGVWRGTEDDGHTEFTMTVEADGTFRFENEEAHGTETLTARWELDEDNYYLNLTDAVETRTPIGEPPGPSEPRGPRGITRFAYAPTDRSPDEIVLSVHWEEEKPVDHPYGAYWRKMERQ